MLDLKNLTDEMSCGYLVTTQKKKLFSVQLDLLARFDELCERAGLQYWVNYGALLGAVRHKGFIPWDDDIDLIMPREDFDRLYSLDPAQHGVKEPYFLQTCRSDPGYHHVVIHFCRSDTTFITRNERRSLEQCGRDIPYHMGINLSVMPLDGVPRSGFVNWLYPKLFYALTGTVYWGMQPPQVKPFRRFFLHPICRIVGPTRMIEQVHAMYRRYPMQNGAYIQSFQGIYDETTIWPKELFSGTVLLPFEYTTIRAPIGYDQILRTVYGDYMQYPSEESIRASLHADVIDAGTSYTVWKQRLLDNWAKTKSGPTDRKDARKYC